MSFAMISYLTSLQEKEEHQTSLDMLNKKLVATRDEHIQEQKEAASRSQADREELEVLRERCRQLELEHANHIDEVRSLLEESKLI